MYDDDETIDGFDPEHGRCKTCGSERCHSCGACHNYPRCPRSLEDKDSRFVQEEAE